MVLLALAAGGCQAGDPGPQGEPGVGEPGPRGEPGEPGGPVGEPSLSGISPLAVYLEHDVDVTISGFATDFSAATVLDFGPGITWTTPVVASPTSLLTRLTIAADAATGPRDVTVGELTLAGALNVEAPLAAYTIADWGTPAQGSMLRMEAVQLDASTPLVGFEPRLYLSDGAGFEQAASLGSEAITSSYSIVYFQPIDVTAPAESLDLIYENAQQVSRAHDALTVAARQATLLGQPSTTGTIDAPRESRLYRVNSSAAEWVHVRASTADLAAEPAFFALPKSGSFQDRVQILPELNYGRFDEITILAAANDSHYLVYWDTTEAAGYDFTLALERTPAGQPLSGLIEEPGHVDWYHLTAQQGDTLTVSVGDGPVSACAVDFGAQLYIYREATGAQLAFDQDICPGSYQVCFGNQLCLADPVSVTIPADGGYIIGVTDSEVYCDGGCPSDYSVDIQVSP